MCTVSDFINGNVSVWCDNAEEVYLLQKLVSHAIDRDMLVWTDCRYKESGGFFCRDGHTTVYKPLVTYPDVPCPMVSKVKRVFWYPKHRENKREIWLVDLVDMGIYTEE